MQNLNTTLKMLKSLLPISEQDESDEKLTKIETLRLAADYISHLTNLLQSTNKVQQAICNQEDQRVNEIYNHDCYYNLSTPSSSSSAICDQYEMYTNSKLQNEYNSSGNCQQNLDNYYYANLNMNESWQNWKNSSYY
jgi:hypothetical protein